MTILRISALSDIKLIQEVKKPKTKSEAECIYIEPVYAQFKNIYIIRENTIVKQ